MKAACRHARILIVDDQPQNLQVLEALLDAEGYTNLECHADPREALKSATKQLPDLTLLDLHMPLMDGYDFMRRFEPLIPAADYAPILVLTADATSEAKQKALASGASDFLPKPFDHIEVLLRIENLLRTRYLHRELMDQNENLEAKVRHRTVELWNAVQKLEETQNELRMSREETINRLSIAAEYRDEETRRHVERMSRYCGLLARHLGLGAERADMVRVASQMHDVGKIGIPDRILLKPGRLTAGEYAVMQEHAVIGYRILCGTQSELGETGATLAWTHHEKVDGSGYPRGLEGEAIPLEGRIAAIADVFDAVTTDRVYRKAFPMGKAIDIIRQGRGSHFDGDMVDVFFGILDEVLSVKEELEDAPAELALSGR